MRALSSVRGVWVLAPILGLMAASCAMPLGDQPSPDSRPLAPTQPDTATRIRVSETYGKLPLHFEANQGQSDGEVKFLSRGRGYSLFLTPTEAVLALHKPEPKAKGKGQKPVLSLVEGAKSKGEEQEKIDLAQLETQNSQLETVVRMKLIGTNPQPQVTGLEELPGKSHYFIGSDPKIGAPTSPPTPRSSTRRCILG